MKEKLNDKFHLVSEILNLFGDNLISIVLFGSRARKNYNLYSDLDIIIAVNKYQDINLAFLRKRYLLNNERRLDLHIFSKEDIIANFSSKTQLFTSLLLGKIILFDKEMFFKNAYNNFIRNMLKEKIKYCEGGKIWEMEKVARDLSALL